MIIGPKQTILVASQINTGATYYIGVTGQGGLTATVNKPVDGTMGAIAIIARAYADTGTGTIIPVAPRGLWVPGAAAAAVVLSGVNFFFAPSAAQAASVFPSAAAGLPIIVFPVDPAQVQNVFLMPSICLGLTVGVANITNLTIEAKTVHMPHNLRSGAIDNTALVAGGVNW